MSKYALHEAPVVVHHTYYCADGRNHTNSDTHLYEVYPNEPQKVDSDLLSSITRENAKTSIDPETGRKVGWLALGDTNNKPSLLLTQNWALIDPTENLHFAYSLAQFYTQVKESHSIIAVNTPGVGIADRLPRSPLRQMRTTGSFMPLGAMIARGLPESLCHGVHAILGRSQGGRSAVAIASYGAQEELFPQLKHVLADDAPTRHFKGAVGIARALQSKEGPELKKYLAATNDPLHLELFNTQNPARNTRLSTRLLGKALLTPELLWSLPKALATGVPASHYEIGDETDLPSLGAFGNELHNLVHFARGNIEVTLAVGDVSAMANTKAARTIVKRVALGSQPGGMAIAAYDGSHALGEYGSTITAPLYLRLMDTTAQARHGKA